jgi:hypothetical protein
MIKSRIRAIAAILYASLAQNTAAAVEPSRPQSPKSQAECMAWGKSYQSYWDDFIAKARQRDEKCKSTFKGSYTSVRSLCANTTGQVDHQNPCDEATMWTGCEWVGYFHGMGACLSALAQNQKSAAAAKRTTDQKVGQLIELDADDVTFLKKIAKQDQFIRDLAKASAGVDAIGDVLGLAVEGPAELLVKWNQGLITEWRLANQRLDTLNKHATCEAIVEHSLDTKAIYYFDQLYAARGCDKY